MNAWYTRMFNADYLRCYAHLDEIAVAQAEEVLACLGLPASYRATEGDGAVTLAPWLVVPGLLSLADVPELQALVAPRRVLTGSPASAAEQVPRLWRE